MELTKEQYDIINSTGNIKINAVAGSGKTLTIIEYAKARPKNSKILYLAFNKSVKLEAINKFEKIGLANVKVETAHSLAYKQIVFKYHYKVRHQGYKIHEVAELLKLKGDGEKHVKYVIANHINKFIAYFCNSDKQKVQDLNYLDVVSDSKAKTFVKTFYKYIQKQTRLFLGKMDKGIIEITHDFYLKKFQLSNPKLNFDYILFDEGQDASPAMLDIFLKQKATKVIVGDTHQQIYSWRFAVNSLDKVDFKNFLLSTSFRFNQDIANLGMEVLKWKNYLMDYQPVSIKGKGTTKQNQVKAILARTNLGLLLKAIEYVNEKEHTKYIYFEGNINSYTYAEEGASLYDVLSLYNGNRGMIRDKLIKEMKDLDELKEYIEKTEDVQLGLMIEIVKEYGNEIPNIIKNIKAKHVKNAERDKAEMIFSTVHRCKGMEYDIVQIVNDFITEDKLDNIDSAHPETDLSFSKLNEEINLLYVAITRTRNSLHIPESLMPKNLPSSDRIHIIKLGSEEEIKTTIKENKYDQIREKHQSVYRPWTTKLDDELTVMYCEGINVRDIAKHLGRTKGAIRSRINKLELDDLYS